VTEPAPELREALQHVDAAWDAARTERTLQQLPGRRRARRLRAAAASGVLVSALGGLYVLTLPGAPEAGPQARQPGVAARAASSGAPGERQLRFADGSHVELADEHARVLTAESSDRLIALRLSSGRARFRITPRPERVFRVVAGAVTVEVLGTTFELTRRGAQTFVEVEHGAVAVRWGAERRELHAGQSGLFPPSDVPATEAAGPEPAPAVERREPGARGWREHAEQGEFKRAYALLRRPDAKVAPEVSDLLLAADAARLSGHPAAAVPYLRQVIDRHPADARAPLAAFTLGGVLMNQLGLPREAEAAYAAARAGTKSPALAQDALARQVEAAHRADDEVLARQLAERYVSEYPRGRRLHAVRRFGGLQ
jgi:transmembrane sensor